MIPILVSFVLTLAAQSDGPVNKTYRGIYFAGNDLSAIELCGTSEQVWLTSYSQQANEFFIENTSYPLYLEVGGRLYDLDRPKIKQSGVYRQELFVRRVLESGRAGSPNYEACRSGELPGVE